MTQPTTDQLKRQAIDALRAWHHRYMRDAAADIVEDIARGTITDDDGVDTAVWEWAESLCTYTFDAQLHLVASDNDNAYTHTYGGSELIGPDGNIYWERLAQVAVEADIRSYLPDPLPFPTDDTDDE